MVRWVVPRVDSATPAPLYDCPRPDRLPLERSVPPRATAERWLTDSCHHRVRGHSTLDGPEGARSHAQGGADGGRFASAAHAEGRRTAAACPYGNGIESTWRAPCRDGIGDAETRLPQPCGRRSVSRGRPAHVVALKLPRTCPPEGEAHGLVREATSMPIWTSTGSALKRPRMSAAFGGGTAAACSQ